MSFQVDPVLLRIRDEAREEAENWKRYCCEILRCVGQSEGTWFEVDWRLSNEEKAKIHAEYRKQEAQGKLDP